MRHELTPLARLWQLTRFGMVGAVGTLAHYALLLALVEWLGTGAMTGTACGSVLGALVNYLLSRRLVFASQRRHREALPRFLLVAASSLLLNALLMYAMTVGLGWHYLVSQLLTTALLLLWNYVANARWTFST